MYYYTYIMRNVYRDDGESAAKAAALFSTSTPKYSRGLVDSKREKEIRRGRDYAIYLLSARKSVTFYIILLLYKICTRVGLYVYRTPYYIVPMLPTVNVQNQIYIYIPTIILY